MNLSSLLRWLDSVTRRLPVDGWSLAVLLWSTAFCTACRAWRIVDFAWGTADYWGLVWLPIAFGVDVAVGVVVWALVRVIAHVTAGRGNRVRLGGRALAVAVIVVVLLLGCADVLSFHISGSALTFQRLRGDDGASVRDLVLVAWRDIWPVLLFIAVSLASLVLALVHSVQIDRLRITARRNALLALLLFCALAVGAFVARFAAHDHGYGRNPAVVFFVSVAQEFQRRPAAIADFVPPPMTPQGFERLFTADNAPPSPLPPIKRAAAATKNVIVFFSEGVPWQHTSLNPRGLDTTPLLKARASREGLQLTRFYSPFHRSIQALFSLFCGDYPTANGKSITELNPRIDCNELSQTLAPQGVKASIFHGGYFSFFDKTAFLGDRAYDRYLDANDLQTADLAYSTFTWGIDDRAAVRALLSWVDGLPTGQRFASVLIPIAAHYPYTVPPDVTKPFGDNRKIDRFLNAVYFVDVVFDELMQGLEQRGLLDDTMVMFMADHGESPHEPPRETNIDRAIYEYDVHVPLVVFQRTMFPTPQTSERLAAIPDVLPTVLDAMQLTSPRIRQGRSFLADDYQQRRVFFGALRSDVKQVGFLDGYRKYILDIGSGRSELYDLNDDPEELNNLARHEPETIARDRDIALTYSRWQYARIKHWPTLGDERDVQGELTRDLSVTVIKDGVRTACTAPVVGEARRVCAGFGDNTVAGNMMVQCGDRVRRCYGLQMPAGGGEIELRVDGARDYFRFLQTMRVAFGPGRESTRGDVSVQTQVDMNVAELNVLTRDLDLQRHQFPAPKVSFRVRVFADHDVAPAPVCLFFGDAPWRPATGRVEADEEPDLPPPVAPPNE